MSDIRKYFIIEKKQNTVFDSNNINKQNKKNIFDNSSTKLLNASKQIIVFTDGSAFNNGKKKMKQYGGIGVFFGDNDSRNISQILEDPKITNNVAELTACIKAIETITLDSIYNYQTQIILYTDSEYTINCITKWASGWQNNGWKRKQGSKLLPVKNCSLIQKLYDLYMKHKVIFKHVRSHQIEPKDKSTNDYNKWYGNMMADKFATQASLNSMNN